MTQLQVDNEEISPLRPQTIRVKYSSLSIEVAICRMHLIEPIMSAWQLKVDRLFSSEVQFNLAKGSVT